MKRKYKNKRKIKLKIISFILILFLLAGYIIMNMEIEEKHVVSSSRNYIIYNMGALPDNLLLFDSENCRQKDILPMLFEGLVKLDSNNNIVPAIAEKYSYDKKNIQYTFNLRKDAVWSDGSSITANDFKVFLNTAFINSSLKFKDYDYAIYCPDDYTLIIKLRCENPDFLYTLCKPDFTLRKIDDNTKDYTKEYKNIAYTGPFYINKIEEDGKIILNKNLKYYDKDYVKSDTFVIDTKPCEIALADFEAGKNDIIADIPFCETQRLIDDKIGKEYDNNTCFYLLLNTDNIKDLNQDTYINIINNAINKDEIISKLNGSFLKKAQNDLKQVKSPSDSDISKLKGKNLKLIYKDDIRNSKCVDIIGSNIKKACSSDINKVSLDEGKFNEAISSKDYDIALCSISDYDESYFKNKNVIKLFCYPLVVCTNNSIFGVYVTKDGYIKFDRAYLINKSLENSKIS